MPRISISIKCNKRRVLHLRGAWSLLKIFAYPIVPIPFRLLMGFADQQGLLARGPIWHKIKYFVAWKFPFSYFRA
jgi:hypothetical protein